MAAFRCLVAALLLLVALPPALCLPHDSDAKIVSRPKRSALPNQWWHHPDHPASALFKRQANETGAAVGSPEWAALFPTGPPENNLPELWRQTLAAAVADGRIPNIPVPANTGGGPVYPPGSNPSGDEICSTTFRCREPGVIWDAPDGMIGLSFDDGPLAPSARLYDFLEANNQKATHFMIGQNILFNPQLFLQAFDDLKSDMSCHTWSHRHTATLTNDQVLAELGWCLQIIHDSTGGRIPRFWRPPYGEADRRVTAIAREVFGLTTVIWNYDTADWQLGQSPEVTLPGIHQQFLQWTSGPKSPGLMILEHELSEGAVDAFIDAYPLFAANGWETVPISELYDLGWYQNAEDSTSPVVAANVGAGSISAPPPTSSSAPPPPPATTAAATSTPPAGGAASVGNNNDAVAFSPSSRWSASVALGSLVLGLII